MSRIIETEKKERDEQNTPLVSKHKIGHTIYIVELHFNFERGETLKDVIQRLINKEVEAIS